MECPPKRFPPRPEAPQKHSSHSSGQSCGPTFFPQYTESMTQHPPGAEGRQVQAHPVWGAGAHLSGSHSSELSSPGPLTASQMPQKLLEGSNA